MPSGRAPVMDTLRVASATLRAAPEVRIQRPDGLVAVGGGHQGLGRALDPEHGRAVARPGDGVRADRRVVLLEDGPARGQVRPNRAGPAARRPGPCPARAGDPRARRRRRAPARRRRWVGAVPTRSWTMASLVRALAGIRAISRPPLVMAMSPSSVTVPMTATGRPQRSQTSRTASQRSGRTAAHMRSWLSEIMTSKGSMSGLAARDGVEVDEDARAGPVGGLGRGAGDAAGAEVLEALHQAALDELQAGLDEQLLGERVADLDASGAWTGRRR